MLVSVGDCWNSRRKPGWREEQEDRRTGGRELTTHSRLDTRTSRLTAQFDGAVGYEFPVVSYQSVVSPPPFSSSQSPKTPTPQSPAPRFARRYLLPSMSAPHRSNSPVAKASSDGDAVATDLPVNF